MIVLRPLAPPSPRPALEVSRTDDTRFAPPPPHVSAPTATGAVPTAREVRVPLAAPVAAPMPAGPLPQLPAVHPSGASRGRVTDPRLVAAAGATALLLAGVAGSAYWGWSHPRVAFTNHLAVPVRVSVGTAPAQTVAPGVTWSARTARADSVPVRWEALPPLEHGQAAGEGAVGTQSVAFAKHPLATASVQAAAVSAHGAVFQPLVTNTTGTPLRIVINAGLSADGRSLETDCACMVPSGATKSSLGLYTLVGNSNVRAIMPDGRSATFANLGGAVDRRSGVVRLRFTPGAFRVGG